MSEDIPAGGDWSQVFARPLVVLDTRGRPAWTLRTLDEARGYALALPKARGLLHHWHTAIAFILAAAQHGGVERVETARHQVELAIAADRRAGLPIARQRKRSL